MFLLHFAVESIGEAGMSKILMSNSLFQPIIAAALGIIPSCAVSVALTELYVASSLSFGSLFAGLCTNAGVGLLVLFEQKSQMKIKLKLVAILLFSGIFLGVIFEICFAFI